MVIGPWHSGKSTFVRSVPLPDVGRPPPTLAQFVDFKRVQVDPDLRLQIYGIMGSRRLDFMWETLCKGMSGYVVLINSTRAADLVHARHIIDFLGERIPVPCVVAANFQDQKGAMSPGEVRENLGLEATVPIVPCMATNPESVREVLVALFNRICAVLREVPQA